MRHMTASDRLASEQNQTPRTTETPKLERAIAIAADSEGSNHEC